MKEIILDVADSDGEVKIETRGFTGKSCTAESAFLKEALGMELAQQLTPAYFQVDHKTVIKKHLPLCG